MAVAVRLLAPSPGAGEDMALVHDYFTQLGGAERVAGRIAEQYPAARLLTSVYDREEVPLSFSGGRPWSTSYLQPLAGRAPLKALLPLLPSAVASLDVRDRELIVSSSSAFGHHVRRAPGAVHICYCATPPRFLWQPDEYFRRQPALHLALSPLLACLRRLDVAAAARVDAYVAVSRHIARRIRLVYARDATVVNPPVDVARYTPSRERSGRFLVVSRLVASKRVELAIEAANRLELPLDVIGKGPELKHLRRLAGPTVRIAGWQPDATVRRALATCEGVVVAGEEDFGLVMAEAQASGRPPIALAAGGAREIIEDGVTGYLFERSDPDAVGEAMLRARDGHLLAADLRASAERFDLDRFYEQLGEVLDRAGRQRERAGSSLRAEQPA